MILDIIFIRHAQSCANIWKTKSKIRQITYKDPEITEAGIETSKRLSSVLKLKIKHLWKNNPYTVGSSQMIRAQETAYYMTRAKSINIIPHIGETGLSLDNFAFSKEKQREIISKRNPNVIRSLDKGCDFREAQTINEKSNWLKFLNWVIKNPKCFAKGSDNVYRGIVFTHSHFLQNSFKLSKSDKIKNNNGIHAIINTDYIVPNESNYRLLSIGDTDNSNGPDKCRISPYASSTRKKRQNYKISHLTRKN
jgi:hypothetical protein